ncbi:methylcrotonoyl-CoA carboxylase subunit alpha, mitochondrial isoform X2 [Venturia canescens]|nr:methylcrotonoyl-CoA carboxylase subunit alpha, mitochondrial isoform X2 [Venturia canescens]XP_043284671.1 methylcrotonoyl-CoA carboxylase subunit alpha, mitochondrial isoform X2 [Venturia canescens]
MFSWTAQKNNRIDKILITNRGEIACRISRTAKKLGVKTVAVYSEADKNSMHVELADEAYCIGPPPSSQSYLRQDKIIAVAKAAKCQAIHPGYGFLSENVEFAELCQKENITFVGPPASAIRDMGIKSTSKAIMAKAGVPIIEGYHGDDQTNKTLLEEAQRIGFPLMIKAVRGGGGKGMRIAMEKADFLEALESARTESLKAFGDSAVLLEKFIAEPRHVEVQIFADKHGNVVHLFERDCSVQRRHQKVIEEAPAPGIAQELRTKLGEAAVRAAKAVGYVGAGTVEFILDRKTHSFHFMEMNTRLQVEHPVTEEITGTDLVEWQLKVAAGETLPLKQEDIHLKGHAFEARIYAEDPRGGFLPGAGPLLHLTPPRSGANIRVETGVRQGDEVSVHYDPMIAKLVVWGKDRNESLSMLRAQLSEYDIVGLETNIEFIKDLCDHPKFRAAQVHTGFIEENYSTLFPHLQPSDEILSQGALALLISEQTAVLASGKNEKNPSNPFNTIAGFRTNHELNRHFEFSFMDERFKVHVQYVKSGAYLIRVNNKEPAKLVTGSSTVRGDTMFLISEIDGKKQKSRIVSVGRELHIFTNERKWKLTRPEAEFVRKQTLHADMSKGGAVSPMPGVVDKIFVQPGDLVKKGDPLVVIIAMKMEHTMRASCDGKVMNVPCAIGDSVAKNKLLVDVQ